MFRVSGLVLLPDIVNVLLQQSINGIVLGCLYVLVALGLTLIYGILNQINFAHADFVTIGAFGAYFAVHKFGWPYPTSLLVALAIGCLLGVLVNAAVFAPLRERGDELRPLIATIGVSILLENGTLMAFGPVPYEFSSPLAQTTLRFGSLFMTAQSLFVVIVAGLAIAGLFAFMKLTFTGKALRAVSQDRETAGLMGINQNQLIMLTIVIASGLAGLAGAMLGPLLVLTPFAGASVIVKSFAIVIIGGFGNIEGTIIAGLLVGLIEAYSTQFFAPGLTDLIVFVLLLVMLWFRPTGLIAERKEENV